ETGNIDSGHSKDERAPSASTRLIRQRARLRRGERSRDRESQSGAMHVGGNAGGPVERLEDALALLRRDAGPAIAHAEREPMPIAPRLDIDRLRGRRVLERVLEQVAEDAHRLREI